MRIVLLLFFLCSIGYLSAQEPEFDAVISSHQVLQNSVFEIQFELRNANGSNFQPPSFADFKIVGGPSVGSSTMIINGQVSRSESWTYSLLAIKEGKLTIGPASLIAGRKKYSTRPIVIEVLAAKDLPNSSANATGDEAVILVADITAQDFYPGQQIVLNYKLLFKENVQTVNTLSEDDYTDFFVQNFNSFSRQATYETINGVTYTSRIIKSLALFAHQSGTYTIDPMVMDVGINAPYPEKQGFFTMRRLRNIQIASEPITINILPLPNPSPPTFSGAVGHYTIHTFPGTSQLTTDDDFSLRLELTGDGDSRRWDPPVPVADTVFELYDPRILEEKINETNNTLINTKSIEYLMIPGQAGEYKVFVPFTFFNPNTKKYETISSDTITLAVAQGQGITRHAPIDQPLSGPLPLRKVNNIKSDDRFWLSIPHLFLFGLLLSGSIWGMIVTNRRRREGLVSETEKIRSSAGRQAKHQLEQLSKGVNDIETKTFFEKATEIFYRFLTERFGIPPSDLDLDKLPVFLKNAGVTEEAIARATKFFQQCLSVRYGAIPGGYTKNELLDASKELIQLLEG